MISQAGPAIEETRDLPSEVFDGLVEHDMFRLVQPRDYGGAELPPLEFMRVIEEVAKHDASTAWCLCQNNVCALISAYLPPATATAIFDSPAGILAWGPGPGEAPISLSDSRSELHTSNLEGVQSTDFSRAAFGDTLAVGEGEHEIEETTGGTRRAGAVRSKGEGGERIWRETLLPEERDVLKRYFK